MKKYSWQLIGLLLIGLMFRIYNFERSFSFAHDQDLYSWIVKDIIVNGHQRLVGQITSVDGVFIGSGYYYLMAVFYRIFNMNPVSAIIPLTLIGLFNVWSIYFVFSRHFGRKTGLIGGLIWAMSFGIAHFERWSVPTQPTFSWAIWFLATILELLKGNYKILPIYAFLVAYIWQLHIALLPITPLPLLAWIVSKKLGTVKNGVLAGLILMACMAPFLIFEVKHDFSQIKAMMVGININTGGLTGVKKLEKVINASGREFQMRLLYGLENTVPIYFWLLFTCLVILARKKIGLKLLALILGWCFMILLAQFVSKRVVSEYYFSNLVPIFVLVISLWLTKLSKKILVFVFTTYLVMNSYWLINKTNVDDSYYYRKLIVAEIKKDAIKNNYPCVAINFIANPGVGVGFRYLLWYQGVKIIKPGIKDVPIYNISIPWQIVEKEKPTHYGRFGVLMPKRPEKMVDTLTCDAPENQLDPLLGYVE
jgi:hypothetical protein